MYAIFKDNKFVSYVKSKEGLEDTHQIKEIPIHQQNLRLWKWEGDFENGRMIDRYEEGYSKEELQIEKQLLETVEKVYPPGVQLTLVIKQLYTLAQNQNLLNEDFKEMADTVLTAVEKQTKRLKFYLKK